VTSTRCRFQNAVRWSVAIPLTVFGASRDPLHSWYS
jgi:hypothetical protein